MRGSPGTVLVLALLLAGCPDDEPTTSTDATHEDIAAEADANADATVSAQDVAEDSAGVATEAHGQQLGQHL